MTDFLTGRVYAPMASFGEVATGSERASERVPTRSAILGLFAAALGHSRHDADGHAHLRELRVAVEVCVHDATIVDYHTAQSFPETVIKRAPHLSRGQLLRSAFPIQTTLSRREYQCDVLFKFAAWGWASGELQELAKALCAPAYVLYAGRKSCPLAAPIAPQVKHVDTVADALAFDVAEGLELPRELLVAESILCMDCDLSVEPGFTVVSKRSRHDDSVDRLRWAFASRTELQGKRHVSLASHT